MQKKGEHPTANMIPIFGSIFSVDCLLYSEKKRGIESIMAPEASVSPLHRRPDNSDIMGKTMWSNIEFDVKICNPISFDMVSLLHKSFCNYFPRNEIHTSIENLQMILPNHIVPAWDKWSVMRSRVKRWIHSSFSLDPSELNSRIMISPSRR